MSDAERSDAGPSESMVVGPSGESYAVACFWSIILAVIVVIGLAEPSESMESFVSLSLAAIGVAVLGGIVWKLGRSITFQPGRIKIQVLPMVRPTVVESLSDALKRSRLLRQTSELCDAAECLRGTSIAFPGLIERVPARHAIAPIGRSIECQARSWKSLAQRFWSFAFGGLCGGLVAEAMRGRFEPRVIFAKVVIGLSIGLGGSVWMVADVLTWLEVDDSGIVQHRLRRRKRLAFSDVEFVELGTDGHLTLVGRDVAILIPSSRASLISAIIGALPNPVPVANHRKTIGASEGGQPGRFADKFTIDL